ncbi:uncharacterized protein MONOS_2345 [Monocercomonoides exilis]|uniref:uncharacterized protein n=1 Tax=Monocercomonoides exilis TaxID=2049356 RepID=UPI00355AB97A|nr:hypothetical protein MONOS_2345 [Monocercomonoides exilis]|eukprot:MONOS_2345.1-p1 / transcript=MONOS_2345.1 / gene=MONOS_2345 / organism=Monocercomonoides_exilis_PA203 / gene_product=unspecified product / transcript_product=unspecified product / location=Mono_scaffold00048:28579-30161(-) / protein_length=453 / sequence_SO=supercontig / SO=protein_coding / is_pseudo=false
MVAGERRKRGERMEREERAALCREIEGGERESNYSEMNIRQEIADLGEMRSETKESRQHANIGEVVSTFDHEKRREREITRDCVTEISREEVQHDAMKTDEDSAYPRLTRQTSEMRNEKIVGRVSGIVTRRREYTDLSGPQDARSEEENSEWTTEGATSWETGEQIERVEKDRGRQTSEPGYKSSMEKSPIPNLTRGEKTQTGVSGNDRNDEQLFIPLGGGIEGRSGEAHAGVGGEVVQPDIHGDKEERKVKKDPGLQSSKRGSAGKTLQDGFPGDSGGTFGGERLDDHSRFIECIPTCQGGRAIQSLSVFQQGCIEIDLTGDSPVPEKSGLDIVGREAEVGTHKERGVSGMVVELREDGSDSPREEESAAPGGCAQLDSTGKEEKETKDERFSSSPQETEFCEVTTPISKLVDDMHAIRAEAGDSQRGLEGNGNGQPNDVGRIDTLEEDPA